MHGTLPVERLVSKRRGPRTWTKKIDPQPIVFADVAELAFPISTLAALGFALEQARIDCSRSALANYLNGSREVPGPILAIVMGEIMRRLAGQ